MKVIHTCFQIVSNIGAHMAKVYKALVCELAVTLLEMLYSCCYLCLKPVFEADKGNLEIYQQEPWVLVQYWLYYIYIYNVYNTYIHTFTVKTNIMLQATNYITRFHVPKHLHTTCCANQDCVIVVLCSLNYIICIHITLIVLLYTEAPGCHLF